MKKNTSSRNFRTLQQEADLTSMFGNQQFFNPYTYYYKLYKKFPHRHWYKDINKSKLLKELAGKYNLTDSAVFETHIHSKEKNAASPGVSTYVLNDELMLCLPPWEFGNSNDAQIYYSDNVKKDELKKLLNLVEDSYMLREAEKREMLMLMQDADKNLDVFTMHIHPTGIKLELFYNDDIIPFHNLLVQRLNKDNEKGLAILHGKPGTGKTTYIRFLCSQVHKQKIFIPSSLNHKIGSPEFLALLNNYKNSILILEDADSILKKRINDEEYIVSNILNLADGLLSDFFQVQIICTFNKELTQTEAHLLRKGKLIGSYMFRELTIEKTQNLFRHFNSTFEPKHEMTLSEILNYDSREYGSFTGRPSIGF